MRRPKLRHVPIPTSLGAVAVLLLTAVVSVGVAEAQESVKVDGVEVRFLKQAGAEDADVTAVRNAFAAAVDAVEGSATFRNFVIAEGAKPKHGNTFTIEVFEDRKAKEVAANSPGGSNKIFIDVGDVRALAGNLGKSTAVMNILVLGHEFKHTDGSSDPAAPSKVTTGPAVDFENTVAAEMGIDYHADNYVYLDNSLCKSDFTVAGQTVTKEWGSFFAERNKVEQFRRCPGGGIAEPIVLTADSPAPSSGSSRDYTAPLAAAAVAGALALAALGWYVRRRLP